MHGNSVLMTAPHHLSFLVGTFLFATVGHGLKVKLEKVIQAVVFSKDAVKEETTLGVGGKE